VVGVAEQQGTLLAFSEPGRCSHFESLRPSVTDTEPKARARMHLTHTRVADRSTYQVPLSDGQLMAKVSAGSVESFVDLYDRYCDRAYRVARTVCHDDGRAQEAVQDGFLAVWRSRENYRPQQGTVAGWLLAVVRYRAIDIARSNHKHASRRQSDDQLPDRSAVDDPFQTAVTRDEAQRLQASLAMLPDAQAEVITLAYYGQLTVTEIAARLGVPAGTIKGRMRLGLKKLRADPTQLGADPTQVAA
jgi:RNA polymerase sigma-70 factor (ECF subfamily)